MEVYGDLPRGCEMGSARQPAGTAPVPTPLHTRLAKSLSWTILLATTSAQTHCLASGSQERPGQRASYSCKHCSKDLLRRCVCAARDADSSVGLARHPQWGCETHPQPGFSRSTGAAWKEGAGSGVQPLFPRSEDLFPRWARAGSASAGRQLVLGFFQRAAALAASSTVGKSMHGWWGSARQCLLLGCSMASQTLSRSPREAGRGVCDVKTSLSHDVFLANLSYPAAWVL